MDEEYGELIKMSEDSLFAGGGSMELYLVNRTIKKLLYACRKY